MLRIDHRKERIALSERLYQFESCVPKGSSVWVMAESGADCSSYFHLPAG